MTHIWRGRKVGSFSELLSGLDAEIDEALGSFPSTEAVVEACDAISRRIADGDTSRYVEALVKDGSADPEAVVRALGENFSRDAVLTKLRRELGTEDPFEMKRIDAAHQRYEAWRPSGVLVHVTAGNSPIVAPMAMMEGLLTGNVNIMKCASNLGEFACEVLSDLCSDPSVGNYVYMLKFSSKDSDTMRYILDRADCVSVWGGEEAVASIREMAPKGVDFVTWGHRISFAYIVPSALTDEAMDGLAMSICRNEQQSCSSPQCVLVDAEDAETVDKVAEMLGGALDRAGRTCPRQEPDDAQAAEITAVTSVHECDTYFNPGRTLRGSDGTWRILVRYDTAFLPSPLFRTVWLSPLPRSRLVGSLRGMRQYLQTAGVVCGLEDLEEVSSKLYSAGVDRVTPVGSMSANYTGEPHDGGYALPRFMRRVTMRMDIPMNGIRSMSELRPPRDIGTEGPMQGKKDYPPVPDGGTRVLMKSGGTTGEPVYCSYTQRDYLNYIVEPTAKAFSALGLDPERDVVADFFKGGNLYGGLNAFISAFDRMEAPHLNISGLDDTRLAAHYMIKGRATAVFGAPSYIVKLFRDNEEEIRAYGRIGKAFYGGEMMTSGQRRYLESMGVEQISGVIYGANETGTMGYQCQFCGPGVYHLCSDIQKLEIVKNDSDEPVGPGETGRLLFTGFKRENGRTSRYDIGDLGRWVEGRCPCGRLEPRFELLGRHGDVVRIGGTFFNYHRVAAILASEFDYRGLLQMILETRGVGEAMVLCVDGLDATDAQVREALVRDYDSFAKTVPTNIMDLEVREVGRDGFVINETSIKLRTIIDRRER